MSRREGGSVNIKDEIEFEKCRLVDLLAMEGGDGSETTSERTVLMSKMLVA